MKRLSKRHVEKACLTVPRISFVLVLLLVSSLVFENSNFESFMDFSLCFVRGATLLARCELL